MTATTITPSQTLGSLIDAHPDLARELERRGFDYCCGGARTLVDACADLGLDAEVVAGELAAATGGAPAGEWTAMSAAELTQHLEATHHRYLWDELPRLSALVDKIAAVHGERHPELHQVAAVYGALRSDLEPHLMKEERVLFPGIRSAVAGLDAPVAVMMEDHDVAGELLAQLRRLTHDYEVPADGCASYQAAYAGLEQLEADTHLHVHKENNVLFPMVLGRTAG
jgi:regulator of cell morphogenesis and NO signaling